MAPVISSADDDHVGLDGAPNGAARQHGQPAGFPDGPSGAQIAMFALQGSGSPGLRGARKQIALQQAGQMRRIVGS